MNSPRSFDLGIRYNIDVVSFSDIYLEIEADIIDDLDKFDLLTPLNFKLHDTKKPFYFYIIKRVCEYISSSKSRKQNILYLNCDDICESSQIFQIPECQINKYRLCKFMTTCSTKIRNMLPIHIYKGSYTFAELQNLGKAELKEFQSNISDSIETRTNYTFSKMKSFAKKYQLTFFNKGYFDQVKIKSIMYK